MSKTHSVLGNPLNSSDRAIPCGKKAASFPEGSLKIQKISTGNQLTIKTDSLYRMRSSTNTSFTNSDLSKQWIDLTDSRFRSWMQSTASISLIKYWGYVS